MGSKSLLPVPRSTRRYPLAVPIWAVCAALRTRHSAWSWPLTWLPWYLSLVPVFPSYLHLLHHLAALPSPGSLLLPHQSSNMMVPSALVPLCRTVASTIKSLLALLLGVGRVGLLCCAVLLLPLLLASTCFTMSAVLHHHSFMQPEVACCCCE